MSGIIETIHGRMMDNGKVDFQGFNDFTALASLSSALMNSIREYIGNPDSSCLSGYTRYGAAMMTYLVEQLNEYMLEHVKDYAASLEEYAGLVHNGFADLVEPD